MNLDEAIGLHEVVEIRFNKNRYSATLLAVDGNLELVQGIGSTVLSALGQLDQLLEPHTDISELAWRKPPKPTVVRSKTVELTRDVIQKFANLKCSRCPEDESTRWFKCLKCLRVYCLECGADGCSSQDCQWLSER